MEKYFSTDYVGGVFRLFSLPHTTALVLIIGINLVMYFYRDKLKDEVISKRLRLTLASLLIVQEIFYTVWQIAVGDWSLSNSLPLHLCSISLILSAIMLIKKNQRLYEIVFFWGLGGASMALLTPDLGRYGFPHFRFFQFFVSHGLIVTANVFATLILDYRPRLKSMLASVAALNIYTVIIAPVNLVTGGNYLYISEKPVSASLMDFMGPWPWYIVVLEIFALIWFAIIYLPFFIKDYMEKKKAKLETEKKPLDIV